SLILVNGLRVNDPETGHLNLDIPVQLDAVTRVDVLHGSGSTFYGSDAIGGAADLLGRGPGAGVGGGGCWGWGRVRARGSMGGWTNRSGGVTRQGFLSSR